MRVRRKENPEEVEGQLHFVLETSDPMANDLQVKEQVLGYLELGLI